MEAKYFATFALVCVVAAVFISSAECTPIPSELEDQANLVDSMAIPSDNMKAPMDKGHRQGRQFGYGGYPYGGYGGMGGYGSNSASAAATATATSSGSGMGYPYGK